MLSISFWRPTRITFFWSRFSRVVVHDNTGKMLTDQWVAPGSEVHVTVGSSA